MIDINTLNFGHTIQSGGNDPGFPIAAEKAGATVQRQTIPMPQPRQESQAAAEFERLRKAVEAAVEKLLSTSEKTKTKVSFSVHKETHSIVIKVMDANTGQLIREMPPEEILDASARIMSLAGLTIDRLA